MADFKEFDDAVKSFEKGWGGKAQEKPLSRDMTGREAFADFAGLPWWMSYPSRLLAGGAGFIPPEENQQAWEFVKEEGPAMAAGTAGAVALTALAPPLAVATGAARVAPYLPRVVPFVGNTLAGALGYSLGDSIARGEGPRLPTAGETAGDVVIDTGLHLLPGSTENIPGVRSTVREVGQQVASNVRDLFTSPAGAAAAGAPVGIGQIFHQGSKVKAFAPEVTEEPLPLNVTKEDALAQIDDKLTQVMTWINDELYGWDGSRLDADPDREAMFYDLLQEAKLLQTAKRDIETVYELAEEGVLPYGKLRPMLGSNEGTAWKGTGGYMAADPKVPIQSYSGAVSQTGGYDEGLQSLEIQMLQDPDTVRRSDFEGLDAEGYREDLRHTGAQAEVYDPVTGEVMRVWGPDRNLSFAEFMETPGAAEFRAEADDLMRGERLEQDQPRKPERRSVDPGGTVATYITPELELPPGNEGMNRGIDNAGLRLAHLQQNESAARIGGSVIDRGLSGNTAGTPHNWVFPLDKNTREELNVSANAYSISGNAGDNDVFRFGETPDLEELTSRSKEKLQAVPPAAAGERTLISDAPVQAQTQQGPLAPGTPHYSIEQTFPGGNTVPEGALGATVEAAQDFVLSGDFQPLTEVFTKFDDLNWSWLTDTHPNLFRFKFKVRAAGPETGKLEYLKEVELPEGMSYDEALDLQDGPYEILRETLGLDNQDYEISLSIRPSDDSYYYNVPGDRNDPSWLGKTLEEKLARLETMPAPSAGEDSLRNWRGQHQWGDQIEDPATRVVTRGPSDSKSLFLPEERAVYMRPTDYKLRDTHSVEGGWVQMDFVGTSSPTMFSPGGTGDAFPMEFWESMLGKDVVQGNAETALAVNDLVAGTLEEYGIAPSADMFGQLFPQPIRTAPTSGASSYGGNITSDTVAYRPNNGKIAMTYGTAPNDPELHMDGTATDALGAAGYGAETSRFTPHAGFLAGADEYNPPWHFTPQTDNAPIYSMEAQKENLRPLKFGQLLTMRLLNDAGLGGFRFTPGKSRGSRNLDPSLTRPALLLGGNQEAANLDLNYVQLFNHMRDTPRMSSSINPSIRTDEGFEIPVATVFQNWDQGMRNIHLYPDIVERVVQNDMTLLDTVPGLEAEKALIDSGELIAYSPQVAGALATLIEERGQDYMKRMLKIPEDMGY